MSKRKPLHFLIEPELKDYLMEWSAESDRSIASVVRRLIVQEAKRREQEAAKAGRK